MQVIFEFSDIVAKSITDNLYQAYFKSKENFYEITTLNMNERERICANVQYFLRGKTFKVQGSVVLNDNLNESYLNKFYQ